MLEQGVFTLEVYTTGDEISFGSEAIIPLLVPHRDELSNMHAFIIKEKRNHYFTYQIMILGRKHYHFIIANWSENG